MVVLQWNLYLLFFFVLFWAAMVVLLYVNLNFFSTMVVPYHFLVFCIAGATMGLLSTFISKLRDNLGLSFSIFISGGQRVFYIFLLYNTLAQS